MVAAGLTLLRRRTLMAWLRTRFPGGPAAERGTTGSRPAAVERGEPSQCPTHNRSLDGVAEAAAAEQEVSSHEGILASTAARDPNRPEGTASPALAPGLEPAPHVVPIGAVLVAETSVQVPLLSTNHRPVHDQEHHGDQGEGPQQPDGERDRCQ